MKKSDATKAYTIHFQDSNGKKMLINGLAVHLVTPTVPSAQAIIAECCRIAKTSSGLLLGGPSGPDISSSALLKPRMYFRSHEDGSDNEELPRCSLIASKPAAIRSKRKSEQVFDASLAGASRDGSGQHSLAPPPLMLDPNFYIKRRKEREAREVVPADEAAVSRSREESAAREVVPADEAAVSQSREESAVIVLDNVTLGEELGDGGEAMVYKGSWLHTDVAVKVFRGRYNSGVEGECDILRKLSHPNIVQFYGLMNLPRKVGLVIELCENDLQSYSERPGMGTRSHQNAEPAQAFLLNIVKDAVKGLVFVHSKGYIHLDVKPSNILIKGTVGKLADFGLTSLVGSMKDATTSCVWPGTPLYRTPELYGKTPPTQKADMWSIGLTLLEVMTGQVPYRPTKNIGYGKPSHVVNRILPHTLRLVGAKNRAIYHHVLSFDAAARQTAEQWLEALKTYIIVDGSS